MGNLVGDVSPVGSASVGSGFGSQAQNFRFDPKRDAPQSHSANPVFSSPPSYEACGRTVVSPSLPALALQPQGLWRHLETIF